MIRMALAVVTLAVFAQSLIAQETGVTQSPILTMDSELVFGTTSVGKQITKNLENKVQELAAENFRIAAELEAEELDLTEKRTTMEAAEFQVLAEAFDEKVQRIRAEQDAKQRALQQLRDVERQSFIAAIAPLLSDVARRYGAVAVLERRNVLLSADSIDITQEVIDRIDAALTGNLPGSDDDDAPLQEGGNNGVSDNP